MYKSLDLLNFGVGTAALSLTQLDGEVYASARTVLLSDSVYVREAVLGRLRQSSFMGSVGPMAALSAGGPALAYANSSDQELFADLALSYADRRQTAFPIQAPPAAPPSPDTVFWAQGIGAWGRFDGDSNAANVSRNLAGGFAGVDRRFAPNWIAGLAAGYTNSFLSIGNPSSSADINTGYLAGYVGANFGPWNLRGAAAGSFSFLGASRSIIFPGFADSAASQYDATTAQVFGEVGYGIAFGPIAAEPFAGLAFVNLHTTSFNETGGGGAAASVVRPARTMSAIPRSAHAPQRIGCWRTAWSSPRTPLPHGSMPSAPSRPRRRSPSKPMARRLPFPACRSRPTPHSSRLDSICTSTRASR